MSASSECMLAVICAQRSLTSTSPTALLVSSGTTGSFRDADERLLGGGARLFGFDRGARASRRLSDFLFAGSGCFFNAAVLYALFIVSARWTGDRRDT